MSLSKSSIVKTHIVPELENATRLENYLLDKFNDYGSRKGIQKAIKRGLITLDNKTVNPGVWISKGQRIDWLEKDVSTLPSYEIALDVVYEDDYLAVINKPSGIVVSGNKLRTIANALLGNLEKSKQEDSLTRPLPVHRLDSQTSGLLLVAKTSKAMVKLNRLFENKDIIKTYQAIVQGKIEGLGKMESPIENKRSMTLFEVISNHFSLNNDWVSLVKLFPKTGRTHQLRIHLANQGFPIVGDRLYGVEGKILKGKGLFLCATGLQFIHPITEVEVKAVISAPVKFDSYLKREEQRWERFNG